MIYILVTIAVLLLAYIAESSDRNNIKIIGIQNKEELTSFSHTLVSKICVVSIGCILIFVSGFRFWVGTDFGEYYYRADAYFQRLPDALYQLNEPGYPVIVWCARLFTEQNYGPLLLAALVTLAVSLYVIMNNSRYVFLPIMLFIFMGGWTGSFNGIRQSLAASFIFLGFSGFRDSKIIIYFPCVILGYLFHKSSLVMMIPFFFSRIRISILNVIIILGFCFVALRMFDYMSMFSQIVLGDKVEFVKDHKYFYNEVNRLRILVGCVPALHFVAYNFVINKEEKISHENQVNLFIVILHAALSIMTMNSPYMARVTMFTMPYVALAVPGLINSYLPQKRQFYSLFYLLFYCIFYSYEIYNAPGLNNFRFIWD